MTVKELGELRRRLRPDKNAISRIYGCYVNKQQGRLVSYLDESLGTMPQDESEEVSEPSEERTLRRTGPQPDRHRVFHSAGNGQRRASPADRPAGF